VWFPRPAWKCAENLASTGVRTPGGLAGSESIRFSLVLNNSNNDDTDEDDGDDDDDDDDDDDNNNNNKSESSNLTFM